MTEVGGHLPFAVEYSKSNRASCKGNPVQTFLGPVRARVDDPTAGRVVGFTFEF